MAEIPEARIILLQRGMNSEMDVVLNDIKQCAPSAVVRLINEEQIKALDPYMNFTRNGKKINLTLARNEILKILTVHPQFRSTNPDLDFSHLLLYFQNTQNE